MKVNGEYLNNLQFADDILSVASSRKQVASMLRELASSIRMHMKTEFFTNRQDNSSNGFECINGQLVHTLEDA